MTLEINDRSVKDAQIQTVTGGKGIPEKLENILN